MVIPSSSITGFTYQRAKVERLIRQLSPAVTISGLMGHTFTSKLKMVVGPSSPRG